MTDNHAFEQWLTRPIPTIPQAELALFTTPASIDVQEVARLDPVALTAFLRRHAGLKVLGIDLGGGSVRGTVFKVGPKGTLVVTDDFTQATESEAGAGFLAQLEVLAAYAAQHDLAVGMSYGGPIDGTVPRYHPKIPIFMDELSAQYGGDLAGIFGTRFALLNDGPAGLLRSVAKVVQDGATDPTVLCLINGGGLGFGTYQDGVLYSTEAGHVACVDELNRNGASKPCGIYGNYVCLENVISNKQGFEIQWQQHTGEHLNGKEIEDRARHGDEFAMQLFEQAALTEATIVKGVAQVFHLSVNDPRCHVVVHGGLHRTPNLRKRMAQILWEHPAPKKDILFTEEFDPNACKYGAALYALAKTAL